MKHQFFILHSVLSKKGVKQVVVQRVTIVLSIAGNGAKLKPYFIFCGNSDSHILYNTINEISIFQTKKAYFIINKNGSMTKAIMENYISTVYLDYIFDMTGSRDIDSILILDSATMYLIVDDFNPYTNNNIYEVL